MHYFEALRGPFKTLSDLPKEEADRLQDELRQDAALFASKRDESYLRTRRDLEQRVRDLFIQRGGRPSRNTPFTMVLGSCNWFSSWYRDTREIRIPLREFPDDSVSFTYGDIFPAMRFNDGKPYRGKVYLIEELGALVERFGLPQDINPDGKLGPERYIEAQIWADYPISRYISQHKTKPQDS